MFIYLSIYFSSFIEFLFVVLFLNYQLYYIPKIYSPTTEGQPSLFNDWLFIHSNVLTK